MSFQLSLRFDVTDLIYAWITTTAQIIND